MGESALKDHKYGFIALIASLATNDPPSLYSHKQGTLFSVVLLAYSSWGGGEGVGPYKRPGHLCFRVKKVKSKTLQSVTLPSEFCSLGMALVRNAGSGLLNPATVLCKVPIRFAVTTCRMGCHQCWSMVFLLSDNSTEIGRSESEQI